MMTDSALRRRKFAQPACHAMRQWASSQFGAGAEINSQRHLQFRRPDHVLAHTGGRQLPTASSRTSSTSSSCTCMMQPRRDSSALAPGVHGDHRAFDDVRGGALHRRVDGAALGVLLRLLVARADFRQVQAPADNGLDVTVSSRALARLVHEAAHARIALEVKFHVLRGRATVDAQVGVPARRATFRRSDRN